jgi:diguanylate cyclase (GGDEF)-like protein
MTQGKDPKEDTMQFLQRLNQDIGSFIMNSIESSSEIETWSDLYAKFQPLRCREYKGCTNTECPAYGSSDYRCWLHAGTLCGGKPQGEFAKKYRSCRECAFFRTLCNEPARALYENIGILIYHLQDKVVKLHDLAIKDPLTGLSNRHFFNEIIEREMAGAERRAEPLSFIMMDMDNFKWVNDSLGHLTGDRLLIEAAHLIENVVRRADMTFRFGGDEFLVLLTNADCDRTAIMLERLMDAVERWNKDNAAAFGCRLSFSVGCSSCAKSCNVHAALNEADERMYENKKNKRSGMGEKP